jgi:HD-like signal output (HDOD) protein
MVKRSRLLAEVPPFHPVAVQLLKLVGDPSSSMGQIVALMRTDAVFTAEVLRLANSSLFGSRCEIRTILQALAFLGLDRINSLLITTAIRGLVDQGRSLLTHSCWRHNLATALICQRLAPAVSLEPERCYVAGLIHDIGRLALLRVFPQYETAMISAEGAGSDLLAAERELFGMDHCEAGRWLLSQWGCPIELQNVAALHECPPAPPTHDRTLICLVRAASQLADLMRMSVFPSTPLIELPEIASAFPPTTQPQLLEHFPELVDWVVTKVNEIEVSLCYGS